MRVGIAKPSGSAWEAARSIAQISWRVDMAFKNPRFTG